MLALIAILIEPDATTATAFGPSGEIVGEARGATIDEVLAALPADPARIVVADDRAAPRGVGVGIVNVISAESASRALGLAGYDVVDTVAMNTHRFPPDRIEALLEAAPDVIFLAGGTNQGDEMHVERLAGEIAEAHDRLAAEGRAPRIVYGGNVEARDAAFRVLGDRLGDVVPNVRPKCEGENLVPAVARLAERAPVAPDLLERLGESFSVVPAGAARAAAVRGLSEAGAEDVFVLFEAPLGVEAASCLGEGWNRVTTPGGTEQGAIDAHRARARELCGIPLLREIADAFGGYTPGRDLLDASPPEFILVSGDRLGGGDPAKVVDDLVEMIRPRRVANVARLDGRRATRLGLAWLAGVAPPDETMAGLLAPLGVVASLDGPACEVRVTSEGAVVRVPAGERTRLPVEVPIDVVLKPRGGQLGTRRKKPVRRTLDPVPAGLLVDARGTPVCRERRVRILPD